MLPLDDARYLHYRGGYGSTYDVTPLVRELQKSGTSESLWSEIWQELYHQGDIGEASYAIVPYLVEYESHSKSLDENAYQFVVSVELASLVERNPKVPEELDLS